MVYLRRRNSLFIRRPMRLIQVPNSFLPLPNLMMQKNVKEPRSDVHTLIATFVAVSVPRKHMRRKARANVTALIYMSKSQ